MNEKKKKRGPGFFDKGANTEIVRDLLTARRKKTVI